MASRTDDVNVSIAMSTKQAIQSVKDLNKTVNNLGKNIGLAFQTSKILAFAGVIKSLTNQMINASKAQAEYQESLNLLGVAYKSSTDEGKKLLENTTDLTNTLKNFYGLDPAGITKQLATYKQMTTAMGMANETSAQLSENLVKLQTDAAALYNLDWSALGKKFQSALANQPKPLYVLGVDVTKTALQQELLYSLGIDEQVNSLNRASKAALTYIAIKRQLANASGHAASEIEMVASQTRIFKEQVTMAARQIGGIFIPVLKGLLPLLNGILMAFNAIMGALLTLFGINKGLDDNAIVSLDDDMNDFNKSTISAGKSVDDLNGKLRSFDKLNVITTPKDSGGASASGGIGEVDPRLLKEMNKYNDELKKAQMKAKEIRDTILGWLGFTIDENGEIVGFKMTLGTIIGGLVVGSALWKGVSGIFGFVSGIGKMLMPTGAIGKGVNTIKGNVLDLDKFGLQKITTGLKKFTTGVLEAATGVGLLYVGLEDIKKNGLNFLNGLEVIAGGILAIKGAIDAVKGAYMVFQGLMAVAMAHPFGLAIAALTGTAGLIALIASATDETGNYYREMDKAAEASRNFNDTVKKAYDEIEKKYEQDKLSIKTTQDYVEELKNIVDVNGKIKEGYEDRAAFIVGQLNEAYGTEIKIVDGVIQKYQEEMDTIDDLIDKKRSEIYMNEQAEKAAEARKKESEILKQLKTDEENYKKAKEYTSQVTEKYSERLKYFNEYAKERNWSQQEYNDHLKESFPTVWKAIQNEQNMQTAYQGSVNTYLKGRNEMLKEEQMWVAQSEKNYDKVLDIYTNGAEDQQLALAKNLSQQTKIIKDLEGHEVTTAWSALAHDNVEAYGYGLSQLDDTQRRIIQEATGVVMDEGEIMAHQFALLAHNDEQAFLNEFSNLKEDVQQNVVSKMYSLGYNISEELQKGINKLNPTIKFSGNFNDVWRDFAKQMGIDPNGTFAKNTVRIRLAMAGISLKADGGFIDAGEMFVAREAGPELVGRIGSKTAVANNDQIVDSIAKGLAMSGINGSTNVTIKADADTQGLLDFINFKQQEKNRQYGM